LKEFIEFLHRGSPGAQVSQVDVDWSDAAQDFKGFDVRW
jgi:acylphosphatase